MNQTYLVEKHFDDSANGDGHKCAKQGGSGYGSIEEVGVSTYSIIGFVLTNKRGYTILLARMGKPLARLVTEEVRKECGSNQPLHNL